MLITPQRKIILLGNVNTERLRPGLILRYDLSNEKRGIRFGTWNVRNRHRARSLTAAARELERYKLDLVGVREVSWNKGGTVRAGDYNFFYGQGNENHQLGSIQILCLPAGYPKI